MKKHITVPSPCNAYFDQVHPTGESLHCDACSFDVSDFETETEEEIMKVISSSKIRVCGRFQSYKVEAVSIDKKKHSETWLTFWYGLQ